MGANEMLTTQEAAAFLGLTVGYLYKLTMQKKIPYYKPFGNRCYFKRDELAQILQSNRILNNDAFSDYFMCFLSNI